MDSVLRDSLHLMVAAAPARIAAEFGHVTTDRAWALYTWLAEPTFFDERVQEWPLVSWQSAVGVVLLYLGGVWLGQQVMAARKPFKGLGFRAFIMAHNLSMTVLSLYMVVQMLTQAYMAYGWSCKLQVLGNMAEPGPTFSPASARLASVLWLHYLSKAFEWVDTFIMVAKKNTRQITFLHLYHHASTFLGWWAVINFAPGGDAYFVGAVNSAVHVVMYSYYFVISTGVVKVPQAIKQGITLLQLLQFTAFGLGVLYQSTRTSYRPRMTAAITLCQAVVFFILFSDFFMTAYAKKRQAVTAPTATSAAPTAKISLKRQGSAVNKENSSARK